MSAFRLGTDWLFMTPITLVLGNDVQITQEDVAVAMSQVKAAAEAAAKAKAIEIGLKGAKLAEGAFTIHTAGGDGQ